MCINVHQVAFEMSAKTHMGLHLIFFWAQFNFNVPERDIMLTLEGILLPHISYSRLCAFLLILGCCIGHPGFTSSLRNVHYATALEMWNLILEKI